MGFNDRAPLPDCEQVPHGLAQFLEVTDFMGGAVLEVAIFAVLSSQFQETVQLAFRRRLYHQLSNSSARASQSGTGTVVSDPSKHLVPLPSKSS